MAYQLLGLASEPEPAEQVAERFAGSAWRAHPDQRRELPYRGMFMVATDDVEAAATAADVALHMVFRRVIKSAESAAPAERVVASFAMVHHPELTRAQGDQHWRDVHGPLALRCHVAMCDYDQLSVVAQLCGAPFDGMAMCAFPDRQTLSEEFFADDAARDAILADVVTFADTAASLPRVLLTQVR